MQTPLLNSSIIIEQIQRLVPSGTPLPQDSTTLAELSRLTAALIAAYQASGQLQEDPFQEAWERELSLYESEIRRLLEGKTVLVTGGEGCVGGHLIQKLTKLGVRRVVSVDKARLNATDSTPIEALQTNVCFYVADIRDYDNVKQIFHTERPHIVFHLAALRIPGLAELQIHETVTSNLFGTCNIIRLCENYNVQQCIFSSTGKASRYFTAEVYAASKKMAEWLFARAAQTGRVRYGAVRFTHMLDNSVMRLQIEENVQQGKPVNIHAPHRYVIGQNVGEAIHLLLNALVLSQDGCLKFLLVRNLGWPVESLEYALYTILQSGKHLPVYFQGVMPGYEESFFMGQVDWEQQTEINTLVNALETSLNARVSSSGDMIVAEGFPFSTATLEQHIAILQSITYSPGTTPILIKHHLAEAVREIAHSSFLYASPERLLKILRWGVNPKQVERRELNVSLYEDTIALLVRSLYGRLNGDILANSGFSPTGFQEFVNILAMLPSIQLEVDYLQTFIRSVEITHSLQPSEMDETTFRRTAYEQNVQPTWDPTPPSIEASPVASIPH
jgi:hypothetical protein